MSLAVKGSQIEHKSRQSVKPACVISFPRPRRQTPKNPQNEKRSGAQTSGRIWSNISTTIFHDRQMVRRSVRYRGEWTFEEGRPPEGVVGEWIDLVSSHGFMTEGAGDSGIGLQVDLVGIWIRESTLVLEVIVDVHSSESFHRQKVPRLDNVGVSDFWTTGRI